MMINYFYYKTSILLVFSYRLPTEKAILLEWDKKLFEYLLLSIYVAIKLDYNDNFSIL